MQDPDIYMECQKAESQSGGSGVRERVRRFETGDIAKGQGT